MLRRITATLSIASLFIISIVPTAAFAKNQSQIKRAHARKLAPELASATSNETVRVIIQSKNSFSQSQEDAITNAGGAKRRSYEALDAVVADVPANALAALAARDDIAYVSPDRTVRAQMTVTRETTGASAVQQGLDRTPRLSGKNIGIAIIDSGVSADHPDFGRRVVAAVDFTGSHQAGDAYGHGTGVAGVAAGSGAASNGYAGFHGGIAPEANIIDLRVLNESGTGSTSSTLEAINWAIQNQVRYNIRVINMSLGTPVRESYKTDPLCQAVERAVRAGIAVVCSAGNYAAPMKLLVTMQMANPSTAQSTAASTAPRTTRS